MINKQQKGELDAKIKAQFVDKVTNKFKPKDLVTFKYHRSGILKKIALFPNIVSIITAGFAVIWFTQDYSVGLRVLFCVIGFIFLIAIELLKRLWLAKGFEGIFRKSVSMIWVHLLPLLLFVMPVSMFLSYVGGDKMPKAASSDVVALYSPQRDSLQNLIDQTDAAIERETKQTWDGKIVRDARKSKLIYEQQRKELVKELQAWTVKDEAKTESLQSEKDKRIVNFGLIFGILACIMDIILSVVFFIAEKDEFDVYVYHLKEGTEHEVQSLQGNTLQNITGVKKNSVSDTEKRTEKKSVPDKPRKERLTENLHKNTEIPSESSVSPTSSGGMFEFLSANDWDNFLQRNKEAENIGEIEYSVRHIKSGLFDNKIKHTYISKKSPNKGEEVVRLMTHGQVKSRIRQYKADVKKYEGVSGKEKFYHNNRAWLDYWQTRIKEFKTLAS